MADQWAVAGVDLHVDLDPALSRRAALEHALRDAVRTGRLAPGARLPATRELAAELGLARNTVAAAYDQLVAEGYLTARRGAGTQVAPLPRPTTPTTTPGPDTPRPRHDLTPGSRRSPRPPGPAPPDGHWPPHRRAHTGTAIHAAGSNCAPHWRTTWDAPAACTPHPSGSW